MSFKSPESVLWNALISDASVTSIVGHKVYPQLAPAADDMPFITWRRTANQREQTFTGPMGVPTGPMGVPKVSVDFLLFAGTYLQVRKLADAVRAVLDGYAATFDNTQVRQTSLESETDDIVSLDGSEVPNAYAVTQTYDVLWQEI
jgi:hypothetical protein